MAAQRTKTPAEQNRFHAPRRAQPYKFGHRLMRASNLKPARATQVNFRLRNSLGSQIKAHENRQRHMGQREQESKHPSGQQPLGGQRATNGTQSCAPSGTEKSFGMTRTMVTFCPLTASVLPSIAGSL